VVFTQHIVVAAIIMMLLLVVTTLASHLAGIVLAIWKADRQLKVAFRIVKSVKLECLIVAFSCYLVFETWQLICRLCRLESFALRAFLLLSLVTATVVVVIQVLRKE
jgi:hypothetical protein